MSLHCFFGVELRADGAPVTPMTPPESSLVITQCALTSASGPAVTLYAQSHDQPTRFAICTLSPAHDTFYCPLQLIFSQKVTFTLVAAKDANVENCPMMHLTGYFESDEDHDGVRHGLMDDGDSSEEDVDDEQVAKAGKKHKRAAKENGKESQPKGKAKETKGTEKSQRSKAK